MADKRRVSSASEAWIKYQSLEQLAREALVLEMDLRSVSTSLEPARGGSDSQLLG